MTPSTFTTSTTGGTPGPGRSTGPDGEEEGDVPARTGRARPRDRAAADTRRSRERRRGTMPRVSYRPMIGPDLLDSPLVIVSGKGGVGKTTVAAALARAAARTRRRVLLAEVEGRGGLSRLLHLSPSGFEERPTPMGFAITEIAPREALVEYL